MLKKGRGRGIEKFSKILASNCLKSIHAFLFFWHADAKYLSFVS